MQFFSSHRIDFENCFVTHSTYRKSFAGMKLFKEKFFENVTVDRKMKEESSANSFTKPKLSNKFRPIQTVAGDNNIIP